MDKKLAPLRLGSPIKFRDRWAAHLSAFEVDEDWEVINVVLKRGLLWSSSVKLPFSAASDWSQDHVSLACTSDEAFGRQLPPLAAPAARTLSARTPVAAAGARLVGALVDRGKRLATDLLIARGMAPAKQRRAPVREISFEGGRLGLSVQVDALPLYRSDEELELLVRGALARYPYLTADDRRGLAVDVADGVVRLRGNLRTTQARERAERAAASIDGFATLSNEIVDDIHLETAVAQALDRAGLSRKALVYPRSSLGVLTLYGYADSAETVEETLRVASAAPGIRSVVNRLELRAGPAAGSTAATSPR